MQLDGEFARLQQLLPWVHPLTQAVEDRCSSRIHNDGFGTRAHWTPIACSRMVIQFGTINGPLPTALSRIDAALEHAGVRPWGTAINKQYANDRQRSPGLGSAYGSYVDRGGLALALSVDAPSDLRQARIQDSGLLVFSGPQQASKGDAVRTYDPVQASALTPRVPRSAYVVGMRLVVTYHQGSSAT